MAASLEKITDEELAKGDVRKRWRTVLRLAAMFNALLNFQIVTNSGKNAFSITASNAVLELNIAPTATAAAATYPWQPYASPYVGAGAPPADQGLRIRIRRGNVNDGTQILLPSNANVEIPVPANCADGFFVWLVASISSTGTMTSLNYAWGTTLPAAVADGVDGALPSSACDLLFIVTSDAATVDVGNAEIMRNSPLILIPQIVNQTADAITRRMVYSQPRSMEDYPV